MQWTKRTQQMLAYRSLQGLMFSRLYDLMRSKRLVSVALSHVLTNQGARTAGIDGVTRSDLNTEEARVHLVEELNRELCAKTYRPRPVRRTYIPKPNGDKRPLGIPTIKDRVVQEMLRLILEPIYEARFHPHSYGFRPFRSTHHAAVRIKSLIGRSDHNIVIEGDIRKCFDRIHHAKLLGILRRTIRDERLIKLIKALLKAGVMEEGSWQRTEEGTPQGGIVSPLLANIYLNELDQFIHAKWEKLDSNQRRKQQKAGAVPCFIVRYADDFVILLRGTREQADALKDGIADYLKNELSLDLSAEKTLVTAVEEGFDFLGFRIRRYPQATLITPSQKAMATFRRKVKQRIWEGFSTDTDAGAIEHINRYVIGWANYYRHVSSKRAFSKLDNYVWWQVFRTSRRLRNAKLSGKQHFKAHYVPYRHDIRAVNRRHRGYNYGAWVDEARRTACIIVSMSFFPIQYVPFHPQHNPYVPEGRRLLEEKYTLPQGIRSSGPEYVSIYGPEWNILRHTILAQQGSRCWKCRKLINGRRAHVHHRQPLRSFKHRQKAHLLENLVALCPRCHRRADLHQENIDEHTCLL